MTEQPGSESAAATVYFRLARAWQLKGNTQAAVAGFQRVVQLDPRHIDAYLELGGLMLRLGRAGEALDYYGQALALDGDAPTIRLRYDYVKGLIDDAAPASRRAASPHIPLAVPAHDNPRGKIDLRHQITFRGHRSGWAYALNALAPLHNSRGILFDGFVERNFAWRHWLDGPRPPDTLETMRREGTFDALATSEERGITPYTRPWAGFLHNPPGMPSWFHDQESPQAIFGKAVWTQSLEACVGLFALSDYHGRWLRESTGKPVSVLTAPTEIPALGFDFRRFLANRHKKIVQVGWWLRKLNAIYQLPISRHNALGYQKVRLVPRFFGNADRYLAHLLEQERAVYALQVDPAASANTVEVQHISDDEYDALLAENIVFVELYDASANNAVIECLARATPLLINPLPAVVEYLGDGYPLYFTNLSEAADKALDASLVHAAHRYLTECTTRHKLSAAYFRRSFEESEVYRLI